MSEKLKIAGYRELTDDVLSAVNANRQTEERLLRMMDHLSQFPAEVDMRWLALSRTYMEIAFGMLNRALTRPERVALPDDTPPSSIILPDEA